MKVKHEFIYVLKDKARSDKYKTVKSRMSAKEAFLKTEKEFRRLNSIVNKNKVLDTTIGNSIFDKLRGEITDSEIDVYAKNHFAAAFYSFLDIKEKMSKEGNFNHIGIKKYGFLINELLYDIVIFANHIGRKVDPNYTLIVSGKANIDDSRWHFLGTFQLMYYSIFNDKRLDNKFAFIISPVALRQTIELKLNRIVGLGDIFDNNGEKIFTKHNFIFSFIKKNRSLFDFKIEMKIVQKIFEFCNDSVHKGIMPYFWQMFYAIKFCDDLFYDPNYKTSKSININSAVKILDYPHKIKTRTRN
ncbi:hypothetical protein [Chryseobacterium binzhouense]|uniref:hypothetical protein n=1 Tax=Chryseobacterium binzhouense TaxID=2593646 RepID=UPI00117C4D8B|nr:hypothetical protein [Chryseobacterium binzhouense]